MSGGLDSSAIAIALMENNYSHVKTYSANFQHVTSNSNIHETKYQKNISDLTSYRHSSIQMEKVSNYSYKKVYQDIRSANYFPKYLPL